MALQVELVSPERIAYSGEARVVVARTVEGDIAFLPGHVPFVGVLTTFPVRVIETDDTEVAIAVHSGFVEVAPVEGDLTRVTILSDVCELADAIDVGRARDALARAETALNADPDDLDAQAALARAKVRLDVAGATPATSH